MYVLLFSHSYPYISHLGLELYLQQRLYGQPLVIGTVINALRVCSHFYILSIAFYILSLHFFPFLHILSTYGLWIVEYVLSMFRSPLKIGNLYHTTRNSYCWRISGEYMC